MRVESSAGTALKLALGIGKLGMAKILCEIDPVWTAALKIDPMSYGSHELPRLTHAAPPDGWSDGWLCHVGRLSAKRCRRRCASHQAALGRRGGRRERRKRRREGGLGRTSSSWGARP